MNIYLKLLLTTLITFSILSAASAKPPMGPPQEAINACSGKNAGDSCSFNSRKGDKLSGECRNIHGQTACVPAGHKMNNGQPMNMQQGFNNNRPQFNKNNRPQFNSQSMGNRQALNKGKFKQPVPGGRYQVSEFFKAVSKISDTGQVYCFDNQGVIPCPKKGERFFGQDAQYKGKISLVNNHNGTVTDKMTGLMWQKSHNPIRLKYYDAKSRCENLTLGGYNDWRLPTITELFSITDFSGSTHTERPYINKNYFDIEKPSEDQFRKTATHSAEMMGQTWSSTIYKGSLWDRPEEAAFFMNFLDGRIKAAPTRAPGKLFYRCVRGKEWLKYNDFVDNHNGTVTDRATGLMWQQSDDGRTKYWADALSYCENLSLAGHTDWRLPNIKELQSIADYRYIPAIDKKFFNISSDKGWYFSSTTHGDHIGMAAYICFGKCISVDGVDVHGAGAQRSDPKYGNPARYSSGMGGQKDQVRVKNYARCVR